MSFKVFRRLRARRGAAGVEYAILVALVALAILGACLALGDRLSDLFSRAHSALETVQPPQTLLPTAR